MSKCLVTGGAGFIGSTLVDELIKKGHQAIVIDNLSTGKKDNLNKDAKFIEADIRDFEKILPYFKGVDFVFHLAALVSVQTSIDNPLHNNAVNLSGTLNVLEAARLSKVKKLVFSSSAAIYGDTETYPTKETDESKPVSPYAVQKLAGEKYCELYSKIFNLPTVNLRYFNIFGDRMALNGGYALVLGIFANQKLNKEVLTITSDGEQRRDFISALDVARANILAIENSLVGDGEVINIGSGKNYSVNELASFMGGPVKYIATRIEPKINLANISKAQKLLGWTPQVSLEDWIKEYKQKLEIT